MTDGREILEASELLIRKITSIGALSSKEERALRCLPLRIRRLKPGEDVLRQGERANACCLVVQGFMHGYKVLANGKRQILAWNGPGDLPDLCSLYVGAADHSLAALTPSKVALITHEEIQELFRAFPRIRDLMWRDCLVQAVIAQAWMTGLGRRSARARLAHLFCELFSRLAVIGLVKESRCPLPMTQAELADALGLTTVHVNRTLQALRGERLVFVEAGYLTILDWQRLTGVAGFDPAYLHLASPKKVAEPLARARSSRTSKIEPALVPYSGNENGRCYASETQRPGAADRRFGRPR